MGKAGRQLEGTVYMAAQYFWNRKRSDESDAASYVLSLYGDDKRAMRRLINDIASRGIACESPMPDRMAAQRAIAGLLRADRRIARELRRRNWIRWIDCLLDRAELPMAVGTADTLVGVG